MVLLNASAALVIAGRAADFAAGVRCAADAIDSGAGLRLLTQLRKFAYHHYISGRSNGSVFSLPQ